MLSWQSIKMSPFAFIYFCFFRVGSFPFIKLIEMFIITLICVYVSRQCGSGFGRKSCTDLRPLHICYFFILVPQTHIVAVENPDLLGLYRWGGGKLNIESLPKAFQNSVCKFDWHSEKYVFQLSLQFLPFNNTECAKVFRWCPLLVVLWANRSAPRGPSSTGMLLMRPRAPGGERRKKKKAIEYRILTHCNSSALL